MTKIRTEDKIVVAAAVVLALAAPSSAGEQDGHAAPNALGNVSSPHSASRQSSNVSHAVGDLEWCYTQSRWREKLARAGGLEFCTNGPCDDPVTRNAYIPTAGTPKATFRLMFHVFAESDGSNPAASYAEVAGQVAQLNADWVPYAIEWDYVYRQVDDSTYRNLSNPEIEYMKATYAQAPELQCNVFVVLTEFNGSFATFPWDPDALTPQGGVVMDERQFGPDQSTLTHELGHSLGLWHTHHGVSEVWPCSDCYERADGLNGDLTGDLCADTPPTPRNWSCLPPGGVDICSNVPWGPTQPENYMGYGDDACWQLFTAQQSGRSRCWSLSTLSTWQIPTSWVDFAYGGPEDGSFDHPYNTFQEGVNAAAVGAFLYVKAGSSPETPTVSKAMTIRSYGGMVQIGQ